VLNRNNEDTVTLDEIDNLQLDLETLLVAATRRMRQLQAEVQSLSDGGDGKKDNKKVSGITLNVKCQCKNCSVFALRLKTIEKW